MGREAKAKAEIRHRRKLFNGLATAEEVHRSAIGENCPCGLPAAIVIRVFAPVDEVLKRQPLFLHNLAAQNGGMVPVVELRGAENRPIKHIRVGMAYACEICQSTAEKEAAKAPSWVVVDINRGPGKDKAIVQVPA